MRRIRVLGLFNDCGARRRDQTSRAEISRRRRGSIARNEAFRGECRGGVFRSEGSAADKTGDCEKEPKGISGGGRATSNRRTSRVNDGRNVDSDEIL